MQFVKLKENMGNQATNKPQFSLSHKYINSGALSGKISSLPSDTVVCTLGI